MTRRCSRRSWPALRGTCSSRSEARSWFRAIRRVAAGESLLDPVGDCPGSGAAAHPRPEEPTPWPSLTPPGAPDPGPDRGGQDQPPDRRGDVPGREDGEELRLTRAGQVGDGAPNGGGCVCCQARRTSRGSLIVPGLVGLGATLDRSLACGSSSREPKLDSTRRRRSASRSSQGHGRGRFGTALSPSRAGSPSIRPVEDVTSGPVRCPWRGAIVIMTNGDRDVLDGRGVV